MTLGVVVAAALLNVPARAQDLDAGKSPAQLFNEVCSACHKNARELKKGVSASFLRAHYTTGSDAASAIAAYINGLPGGGAQPKRPPANAAATPTEAARQPARPLPGQIAPKGRRPAAAATAEAAKPPEVKPPEPPPAPSPPPPPALEPFEE